MRTTLTVDDKIDARLRRIAAEQGYSYKDIVNLALLKGLARLEVREAPPAFVPCTKDYGLRPGVDEERLNQMEDELAIDEELTDFGDDAQRTQGRHDHP